PDVDGLRDERPVAADFDGVAALSAGNRVGQRGESTLGALAEDHKGALLDGLPWLSRAPVLPTDTHHLLAAAGDSDQLGGELHRGAVLRGPQLVRARPQTHLLRPGPLDDEVIAVDRHL